MKALLTGGAGFVGSHLTEALLAAGHSEGEAASAGDLDLRWFSYAEPVEKEETRRQAFEYGAQVARLLDLPLDQGS